MAKRGITLGIVGLATLGLFMQPSPSPASAPQPKVGDCLIYQDVDVFVAAAKAKPVKCSGVHNVEIYRISKFKSGQNLSNLDPLALSQLAQSTCTPWKGTSAFLNQWTFRVPSNSEWKTGARWFRCEALKTEEIADENGRLKVQTFRGKKLDFK
jgi:hypothetical protein